MLNFLTNRPNILPRRSLLFEGRSTADAETGSVDERFPFTVAAGGSWSATRTGSVGFTGLVGNDAVRGLGCFGALKKLPNTGVRRLLSLRVTLPSSVL
jgi:hypothetical protein